jgi:hypothetical protein
MKTEQEILTREQDGLMDDRMYRRCRTMHLVQSE